MIHLWVQICLPIIYLIVHPRAQWDWNPGFMNPSRDWSEVQLHLRQAIGPQVIPSLRPFIYNGVAQLVKALIDFEGNPAEKIEM